MCCMIVNCELNCELWSVNWELWSTHVIDGIITALVDTGKNGTMQLSLIGYKSIGMNIKSCIKLMTLKYWIGVYWTVYYLNYDIGILNSNVYWNVYV